MVRTVISLEEEDKRWLDQHARKEGVSMTEIIRRAVRLMRRQSRLRRPSLAELLDQTAGIWKHGDGLKYQEKIRREW